MWLGEMSECQGQEALKTIHSFFFKKVNNFVLPKTHAPSDEKTLGRWIGVDAGPKKKFQKLVERKISILKAQQAVPIC